MRHPELVITILLSTLLTGVTAFSSDQLPALGACDRMFKLRPLPEHHLTLQEQAQFEPELYDLFKYRTVSEIKANPHRESHPSYLVSFAGTAIRAVLKKAAHSDLWKDRSGLEINIGLRGAISSESAYKVSSRMGCYCYPFTTRRTITDSDPLHQKIEGLEYGRYIVTYLIENAVKFPGNLESNYHDGDPKFGRISHRDAAFVRVNLFELIIGDADGLDAVYDPVSKTWIGVDGVQSFMRDWTDLPVLGGNIPLNMNHYLNDREFFDQLADRDPDAIFAGLERMHGPTGFYSLRYEAAKHRLVQVQNFARQMRVHNP